MQFGYWSRQAPDPMLTLVSQHVTLAQALQAVGIP